MYQKNNYEDWVKKEINKWTSMGYNIVQKEDGFEDEKGKIKSYWDAACFEALRSFFTDCSYLYTYVFDNEDRLNYYVDFMVDDITCRYSFCLEGNNIISALEFKNKHRTHYADFMYAREYIENKNIILKVEEKYKILKSYMMNMPHIRMRLAVGELRCGEDSFNHEKILTKLKFMKVEDDYGSKETV